MIMKIRAFILPVAFVAGTLTMTYVIDQTSTSIGVAIAHADTIDAGSGLEAPVAPAKPSSVTVTQSTTVSSADQLHDVITDPAGAAEDVKSLFAMKVSYGVLALLILITRVIARIPGKAGVWLRTGYRAAIITGVGTVATALFNVALTGAGWTILFFVAIGAIATLMDPVPAGPQTPSSKPETKAV
jgi:hypothetical protein